jgi:ABC-type transport system substrate-binding protein
MIPSPKAAAAGTLSEHPVGAGPFAFADYKKEQVLSVRKYTGYWDAKAYKLAGVDFTQVGAADPNASLSALFAGETDLQTIQQSQVDAVKAHSGYSVTTQPSQDSYYFLAVCQTTPPFDKAKFRQALQFAVDRDELNQVATNGTGLPGYMAWPKGSQYYVPAIAKRFSYNPKKARQLLKEAGVAAGTSFNFISPVGADLDRLAVVIKDELAKVGLNANVLLSQNIPVDLYENNKAPLTISLNVFPGVERLTRRFSPESAGNWCHYDDPKINGLLNQIAAGGADATKTKALWTEVQGLVADFGAPVILFFSSLLAAHSDNVAGLTHIYPSGQGVDLAGVYIKK